MDTNSKPKHVEWGYGIFFVLGFLLAVVGWVGQMPWIFLLGCAVLISVATSLTTYWVVGLRNKKLNLTQHPVDSSSAVSSSEASAKSAKMRAILNSVAEAIIVVDKKSTITLYNSAALELIDSHDDIVGQQIQKVLPLWRDGTEVDPIAPVLQDSSIAVRDDLTLRRGSDELNIFVTVTPMIDRGQMSGAIIQARDISRQKSLESQKDEFLSVISHELRTPVAIVEADLSTALTPGFATLPPKANKLIVNARQNLLYLSALLQDISDLSHSERLVLDTEMREVRPQKFVHQLIGDFTDRAQKEGLTMRSEIDKDLPTISTSEQRLQEIMMNFLTNAIKYSAGKGQTVLLTARPSKFFAGGVRFAVVDEGVGISPADQKKLFKKFYRANTKQVQKIQGTGMGLYIVQRQAHQIGARLGFRSELKRGSAFSIDLPAKIKADKLIKAN